MISLKLLSSLAGNNFSYARNDQVDWPDDEDGCRLIDHGHAQPVGEEAKQKYDAYVKASKAVKVQKRANVEVPPIETPAVIVPIDQLDLDEATLKVLKEAGLASISDVVNHPDLTQIKGIAKATKEKILKAASAAQ